MSVKVKLDMLSQFIRWYILIYKNVKPPFQKKKKCTTLVNPSQWGGKRYKFKHYNVFLLCLIFWGEDVKLISAQSDCHGDCLEGRSNQEESNFKRFPLCVRINQGCAQCSWTSVKKGEYMYKVSLLWLVAFIRVITKYITEQNDIEIGSVCRQN